MDFHIWRKNDILCLNKYGILEPIKSLKAEPSVILEQRFKVKRA